MLDGDEMMRVVTEHVTLENAHDFPACIGTFGHARYEVMATAETFDGSGRVDVFLSENRTAFPDFEFVTTRMAPTPSSVMVEGRFTGTHEGTWRGLPATGRRVDIPMCIIFDFEADAMVNERLYFDLTTALRQLGVADDPNSLKGKLVAVLAHPITITRAMLRKLRPRRNR